MDDMPFHAPVAIAVGAGFKREIASLAEMENFLAEWSPARRGRVYAAAVKACDAARSGRLSAEQARRALVIFVETAGIAWSGVDPVTVLRRANRRRRAGRAGDHAQ